jgi:hypothetical protein
MNIQIGTGDPKPFAVPRRDVRVPIEVGIHLIAPGAGSGKESTFTQDVSARGAKVLSAKRWKRNQRLTITALRGGFQSLARVAYCKPVPGTGFAVGLELLNPTGKWIVARADANEMPLSGGAAVAPPAPSVRIPR